MNEITIVFVLLRDSEVITSKVDWFIDNDNMQDQIYDKAIKHINNYGDIEKTLIYKFINDTEEFIKLFEI